jgi:adenylate cyclase
MGSGSRKWGDGSMVQFASALDAVNCAIEIQEAAEAELNAKLRIGIHLGDITIEKDEIYGDGVNIASRIESGCRTGINIHFRGCIWCDQRDK